MHTCTCLSIGALVVVGGGGGILVNLGVKDIAVTLEIFLISSVSRRQYKLGSLTKTVDSWPHNEGFWIQDTRFLLLI